MPDRALRPWSPPGLRPLLHQPTLPHDRNIYDEEPPMTGIMWRSVTPPTLKA